MTVPYTSDEAAAVGNAITMLSQSAEWQAEVGAANAAAALERIMESWGGTPGRSGQQGHFIAADNSQQVQSPPFAIVHAGEFQSEDAGVSYWNRSGRVTIECWSRRQAGTDTPPETFRRARNLLGAIRAELEAQRGQAGAFATFAISTEGPLLPDDSGADGDAIILILHIDWQG